VRRKWAEIEVARNTAGQPAEARLARSFRVLVSQDDVCARLLAPHADNKYLVQVLLSTFTYCPPLLYFCGIS
jgi:hypothetical protein